MKQHSLYLTTIRMVFLLIPVAGYCQGPLGSTPTWNRSYISEKTVQVPEVTSDTEVRVGTVQQIQEQVTYVDGLGRPIQLINTKGSPSQADNVHPMWYDLNGRQTKKYLPYTDAGQPAAYKTSAIKSAVGAYEGSAQYLFYQAGGTVATDIAPFSQAVMEASPMDRVVRQGAVGQPWQPTAPIDRTIRMDYKTNDVGEVLLLVLDDVTGEINLGSGSAAYYDAGALFIQVTTDEHNNEIVSYTDKDDRVVLKKVQWGVDVHGKLYAETYYLYDLAGNVLVVLPPEATRALKSFYNH